MSENGKLTGLSAEQINKLLMNRRNRGGYEAPVTDFANSDEAAISVKDNYPLFAGKKGSTLYQGFRNAAEKLGYKDQIQVVLQGEDVFLFHNARLEAIGMASATTE
jgi:di/tripeptidase